MRITDQQSRAAGGRDLNPIDLATLADVGKAWLRHSPDGVLLLSRDGHIAHINTVCLGQMEIEDVSAWLGAKWLGLWPRCERAKLKDALERAGEGQAARVQVSRPSRSSGARTWELLIAQVADTRAASTCEFLVLVRDVTAIQEAQARQAQSRRLESIGRLTGGVAHDFNNLLTVMMSASETLAEDLSGDAEHQNLALVSLEAAERAADLVRRLLAFSRKLPAEAQSIDCGEKISTVSLLMRRTLREDIEFVAQAYRALLYCKADRAELESALLNLCINARDAMPRGGVLELSVEARPLTCSRAGDPAQTYAVFTVRDTGVGMSAAVLERAVEPFFTTKGAIGGSGFGLSTVHGFAGQHSGRLEIASREGVGTTVELMLPVTEEATQAELRFTTPDAAGGGRHVLLVEDDAEVRSQAARTLTGLGYRVTEACDGRDGLRALNLVEDIDLMMTDLRMPNGMNGRELAAMARLLRPSLKVLFTSGYLEEFAPAQPGRTSNFLAKPYRRAQLAASVSAALNRYDAGPAGAGKKRRAHVG